MQTDELAKSILEDADDGEGGRWVLESRALNAIAAALRSDRDPAEVENEAEALGWAKATAWHHHGIAWEHLEQVSRDELLAAARLALQEKRL